MAEEEPEPHGPADAEDRPGVAKRAVGQARPHAPQRPQVAVLFVARQATLKEVDTHVLLTFALGVPQDRRLDRLDLGRIDSIELILGEPLVAGGKSRFAADDAETEQRLGHAVTPAPVPAAASGGR